MAHQVFISHSSKDRVTAERVCSALEEGGIPCWIAPRDVTPGANYGRELVKAIEGARILVLLLSSNSNRSVQVAREVERAGSKDVAIVPFRIEDVKPSKELEFFVSSHHWLDAIALPLEPHLERLLDAVRSKLSAPATMMAGDTPPKPGAPATMMATEKALILHRLDAAGDELAKPELLLGRPAVIKIGRCPHDEWDGCGRRYPGEGDRAKYCAADRRSLCGNHVILLDRADEKECKGKRARKERFKIISRRAASILVDREKATVKGLRSVCLNSETRELPQGKAHPLKDGDYLYFKTLNARHARLLCSIKKDKGRLVEFRLKCAGDGMAGLHKAGPEDWRDGAIQEYVVRPE